MNNLEINRIFKNILKNLSNLEHKDAMDIDGLLMNWNDSVLNEDRDEIIRYPGRDRLYSYGKEGGKVRVSKRQFIEWLISEEPFNEIIYGKEIQKNKEWTEAIETARKSISEILIKNKFIIISRN